MLQECSETRSKVYFNSDNCFTLKESLAIKALTFSWMPSWWKSAEGILMNERYVMDPDYRETAVMAMECSIAKRYPMMKIGNTQPSPAPVQPNWINATTVAAAGGRVIYSDDNYPSSVPLSEEAIDDLKVPEVIEDIFPYSETIRQVEYMNRKYGTNAMPSLFKNGIANDLIQLFGDQVILEMLDETPRFQKLLDYSLDMWDKVLTYNLTKGSMPPMFMLLNCSAQLIGPVWYKKFLFEHDLHIIERICRHNHKLMLHHCGCLDPFIDMYRKIPHVDMVQIGFTSDIRKALDAFPEADIEYIVSPYAVFNWSRDAIHQSMQTILSAARGDEHRFSLVVADLENGTPDENVIEIYQCCKGAL